MADQAIQSVAVTTVPAAIQDDVNNLHQEIQNMKTAIQKVRDARKKLHDDTQAWVHNNIKKALESAQDAEQEEKKDVPSSSST